jgi:PAS domain S-box-containing protein
MMKKVLIVDDNSTNLYMLKSILEEERLDVIAAENGKEALERALADPPDLIVSDILMPVMDGYTLCRQCKSDEHLKQIPFIFYTATYTEPKDEMFALSLGADRFILKPQEPEILLNLLKEYIEGGNPVKLAPPKPLGDEMEFFRGHNEILFRKLEKKMLDLEIANQQLKESEKKYRDLFDFLPIPVYEMDFEANIISANRSVYETFRGSEEDLKKGFKAWQLLSPEAIDKSSKNIERLLKGEQLGGTEYTLKRLDGSVFPGIVISSVIYSHGKPVGLRGAIVDITQRKQQEEELLRTNTLLDLIIENIPDMIFLKDAGDLRFVRFNRAGEALLGHSRSDLLGKNDYDLFPKEQADFFTEKDREVLRGKELMDIPEEPIQTGNRGERTLHTKKVPILDANGEPEYLLGISEDITERKRMETERQQNYERLRKTLEATVHAIAVTVETRDPYTAGHQRRVADLSKTIASEMGLATDQIDGIYMASKIHDIGKISVPAEILSKPTKLTHTEFSLIKVHAQSGYEILKDIEFPWPIARMVLEHHERMDGSGYPRNLKGEEILIEARILAVADVVEAMASYRPYRPGLGIDAALAEIEKNRGIFYDDAVADACLRLFREKGFKLEGT